VLWEWRISQIGCGDPLAHSTELKAFGTWFGSGKFDDAWALPRLREVLEMNGQVELDARVINRLANVVNQFTIQVLECAILLARGIARDARLYYWRDDLLKIISTSRGSEDHEVLKKCDELVSILLSKGMIEAM
jgi:hypothetical protein